MVKGIFCSHCGTNNLVKSFRCSQCGAFVRPVYPTVAGIGALLAIYAGWLFFMKSVLPSLAGILAAHGAKFSLPVRLTIEWGRYFTGWGILVGLLGCAVLLWLGLFWKPDKAYGRNFVITVVLVKAVSIIAVLLLAMSDVLPFVGTP